MIKYNLICKCKQTFESWFSSSLEFDSLRKRKLIKCIYCESSDVKKTVMSPNLSSKSNKIFKRTKLEKKIKKQILISIVSIYVNIVMRKIACIDGMKCTPYIQVNLNIN